MSESSSLFTASEVRFVLDDCLNALGELAPDTVDLVYLDPPFNTGQTQRTKNAAFADSWATIGDYLDFMRPRLELMHRALRRSGSILLHCDWRTCHHFRVLLDEMFGETNFVNHLVWRYGLGGSSPRRFARKHDDILFYAKESARYWFEAPLVPATSQRMRGQLKKCTDVLDVPSINNMASERNGWPTQKPLALLELLVSACCPPDGLVVDPFCGSGTTLEASKRLGRRAIGIDTAPEALEIARRRAIGS